MEESTLMSSSTCSCSSNKEDNPEEQEQERVGIVVVVAVVPLFSVLFHTSTYIPLVCFISQ